MHSKTEKIIILFTVPLFVFFGILNIYLNLGIGLYSIVPLVILFFIPYIVKKSIFIFIQDSISPKLFELYTAMMALATIAVLAAPDGSLGSFTYFFAINKVEGSVFKEPVLFISILAGILALFVGKIIMSELKNNHHYKHMGVPKMKYIIISTFTIFILMAALVQILN